jgi:hypothetical protein
MTPARLNREMKSFCDDFRPYLGADIIGSNEDMLAAVRDAAAER